MASILLTAPAVEPLSHDDAKAFLRVEHDAEDDFIAALVAAARLQVEAQTRRALIAQTWRLILDRWPDDGRLPVRPGPLRDLVAARVYDVNNVAHAIDLQSFVIDTAASAIVFAPWALAVPGRLTAGIALDVSIGYGAVAADVPEPLRQAIRLIVAHGYEYRGTGSAAAPLPSTAAALIAPYRMLSL